MIDDADPDEATAQGFRDWLIDLIFRPPDTTPGDGSSAAVPDRRILLSPGEPAEYSDPISFDDDTISLN